MQLLVALSLGVGVAGIQMLLDDARQLIKGVPFTQAQRIQLIDTAVNVLSISPFPHENNSARDIRDTLVHSERMDHLEFHLQFADLFNSFNDQNAQYHIPGSHACVKAFNGLTLAFATSSLGRTKIMVSKVERNPLSPNLDWVYVGDELQTIDVRETTFLPLRWPFATSYSRNQGKRIESLYRIDGKTHRLPFQNAIRYGFTNPRVGNRFITLRWMAEVDQECVKQSQAVLKSKRPKNPFKNIFGKYHSKIQRAPSLNPKLLNPSINNNVKWSIFEPAGRKLGVIALSTFGDSHYNATQITLTVRDLLQRELVNTTAIVFDVRSPADGPLASAAELIPQLFAENPVITGGGILSTSPINDNILSNSRTDRQLEKWIRAYNRKQPGDQFTPLVKFTENRDANLIGRVYEKPIGVFTSRNCAGACEVFAATMETSAGAIIFGEDDTTSGMASYAVDYNSFLNPRSPTFFPALPYADVMPMAAPNFKIGWQRYHRYNGTLDTTPSVHVINILPDTLDLRQTNEWSTQFDKIANHLLGIEPPPPEIVPRHPFSDTLPNRVFESEEEGCVVCQEKDIDTIIVPCGHMATCMPCCQQLGKCPLCRQLIGGVVRADVLVPKNYTLS